MYDLVPDFADILTPHPAEKVYTSQKEPPRGMRYAILLIPASTANHTRTCTPQPSEAQDSRRNRFVDFFVRSTKQKT